MSLLVARGLTKRFGGLVALDAVGFTVEPGEIHALIGPNGAGKSTLVNVLSGLLVPDAGSLVLDGADLTRVPAHRRVHLGLARCFQVTSVFGRDTVLDNLTLAVQAASGSSFGWLRPRDADRALRDAARAARPKLLLLDEPLAGMGPEDSQDMIALIGHLRAEAAILLIEHDMDAVFRLADRISVLDYGRVLASGTPDYIRAHPEVQAVYLGTEAGA